MKNGRRVVLANFSKALIYDRQQLESQVPAMCLVSFTLRPWPTPATLPPLLSLPHSRNYLPPLPAPVHPLMPHPNSRILTPSPPQFILALPHPFKSPPLPLPSTWYPCTIPSHPLTSQPTLALICHSWLTLNLAYSYLTPPQYPTHFCFTPAYAFFALFICLSFLPFSFMLTVLLSVCFFILWYYMSTRLFCLSQMFIFFSFIFSAKFALTRLLLPLTHPPAPALYIVFMPTKVSLGKSQPVARERVNQGIETASTKETEGNEV